MFRLRVKEVAHEKGIELTELARLAGLNVKTIRRIYNDPYAPMFISTLYKLADALGVDPRELIGPEKEGPQEEI